MTIKRLKNLIFLHLARLPMPGHHRAKVVRFAGVDIPDTTGVYIREKVVIDTSNPKGVHIAKGVHVTNGCVLLTHFKNTKTGKHEYGNIYLEENAWLGSNVIVCKPVRIGKNAVVGAGAVVTKDIPANEVWAGNPARFIKIEFSSIMLLV